MTQRSLGRLAFVFSVAAIVSATVRYTNVHAQQVGKGGAPALSAASFCTAANNCAALNAPNTFTADQTISSGHVWKFPTGDGGAIGMLSSPGDFYIEMGGGYTLQVIEQALGSLAPGLMVPARGCMMWASQISLPQQAPESALCERVANVYSFGSTADATDGWIQAAAIGNGASGNSDLRGHLTLSSGTASYAFTKSYTVAPTCVAADTTTTAAVKVSTSTTTLTVTGTGSDVLSYVCAD